mmetsp:Transcript_7905/g.11428  ORF Transcript_7905/g.11428 Transcript_7905/m.11428 type:complete len:577 (+) Transcript_7905:2-1732(+)
MNDLTLLNSTTTSTSESTSESTNKNNSHVYSHVQPKPVPTHQRNESDSATASMRSFDFDSLSVSSDDSDSSQDNNSVHDQVQVRRIEDDQNDNIDINILLGRSSSLTTDEQKIEDDRKIISQNIFKRKSKRTLSWDDCPLDTPRTPTTATATNTTSHLDTPPKSILKKSTFSSHHRAKSEGSSSLNNGASPFTSRQNHQKLPLLRHRSLGTTELSSTPQFAFVDDLPLLESMLKSRQIKYGPTHVRVSQCWNHIGNYHFRRQNHDKALEAYRSSVQYYEQKHQVNNPALIMPTESTAAAYSNMGTIYWSTGDFQNAITSLKKSIAIHEQLGEASSLLVANCLYQIGLALSLQRDYIGAMDALLQCHKIRKEKEQSKLDDRANSCSGRDSCSIRLSLDLARVVDAIGKVHFFRGDYQAAMECHQEALATKRHMVGDGHASVITSMINIGVVHKAMKQTKKALQAFHFVLRMKKLEVVACQQKIRDSSSNNNNNNMRCIGESDRILKQKKTSNDVVNVASMAAIDVGDTLKTIGELHQGQGDFQTANLMFLEAITYYEFYAALPSNHAKIIALKWMIQ